MGAKKFFLIGFILVLLTAIPLTLYLLQQQQQTQSHAAPSTTLTFTSTAASTTPASTSSTPLTESIGTPFDLHVTVDPGSNLVSYVDLVITYDPSKFSTAGAGFAPNLATFSTILSGPVYQAGKISVELSIGTNSTAVLQAPADAGTLTLKPLTANTPAAGGDVQFSSQTIVYASCINPQDPSTCPDNEATNVLSTTNPAWIAVAATPTTPTPTNTPTPGPTTAAQAPVCTSLNADRNPSGASPFAIALTASGNAVQGTVSKISFNFGDGPVQDVTTGGGIGTKNASVQLSHTYNNAGTFKATATLTDSQGTVSDINSCTLTVTVNQPTTTPGSGGGAPTPTIAAPTATPTPTLTPTPTAVIIAQSSITPCPNGTLKTPCTGPGDTFINIGIGAGILSAIGAAIFLLAL